MSKDESRRVAKRGDGTLAGGETERDIVDIAVRLCIL